MVYFSFFLILSVLQVRLVWWVIIEVCCSHRIPWEYLGGFVRLLENSELNMGSPFFHVGVSIFILCRIITIH